MAFGNKFGGKRFKSSVEVPKAPPPPKFRPKPPPPPEPTPKEKLAKMTAELNAANEAVGIGVAVESKPEVKPDAIAGNLRYVIETYSNDPVGFVRDVLQAEPDEWQMRVMEQVAAGARRISVRAGHGVGKALRHDEPVLTPAGWVPISSLLVGDKVATVDGSFTEVTGVYPQGKRQLYRVIMEDGCSVVVDREHRWTTWTRSERKHKKGPQVRTTLQIAQSLTFSNGVRTGLNHMIPTVAAIDHPRAILPVEPYLFGVWLGDGGPDGRITNDIEVRDAVYAAGGIWQKQSRKVGTHVTMASCEGLRLGIKALGCLGKRAHEKSIPRCYMHGSKDQRIALLQGLLDTDGTVGKNMAVVFDVVSKDLADDVAELVRSLGGVARRGEKQGMYYNKVCRWVYRVYISLPEGISPFRIPSKANKYKPDWSHKNRQKTVRRFIKSIEPVGVDNAFCISVAHESCLFVTRDHIVTHNSTFCAWLSIWHCVCFYPQKTVMTAPTAGQLFDALFVEIKLWINRLPAPIRALFEMTSEKVVLKAAPEASFISARTSSADRPEALAGIHSEHVLLIVDEASAVPEAVYESAAGSMSGHAACTILIGNPTRNSGLFFKTHHALSSEWKTFHVSCLDSPRVAQDFVKQIADTYGPDSNAYRVRVLGEFALRDDDTLISAELVDSAMSRDVVLDEQEPLVYGIDVARFGDDRSTLCRRRGNVVVDLKTWQGLDLMQLTGAIVNEAKLDKPAEMCIDSIGLGSGVADRLRELGYVVRDVNVSEASAMNPQAAKLRDELWLAVKEWLNQRACKLPRLDELRQELVAPTYTFTSNGKIKVEGKAEMKRRGMRSPDLADALCLTFASVASRVGGRGARWVKGKPLKRGIKGVV